MYSLLESSSNILRFILVVSFILNQPTIESFFYALGIHQLIISFIVLIVLRKNNSSKGEQISFLEYVELCKNNFYKIRTDQAVGLIPIHLDVVIIGYFANYYSAGIYRIAKKLVDPINFDTNICGYCF
jgi:O-antigen/teichoic acid export membrane protein